MTKPELEALDEDILALLEQAKPVPALDGAKKAALLADVMGRIGTLPPGGGDGGGGGGAGGGAAGGAGAGVGAVGSKIALGVAFAVGVAAGVVGDRAVIDRTPAPMASPSSVTTIVIPSMSAPAPAPAPESAEAVPVGELPSAPVPSAARSAPMPTSEPMPSARGLAAERALLDVARAALARGEAGGALDAAERHRRDYPDGALVEEREAIAIKALVALGRRAEAAQRLANLEKTHPNSMVLRAAKKAVSGTP